MSIGSLFDEHADRLLLLARQWAAGRTAEDAVQQGFVDFWRGDGLAADDPVPYLYACVRNAARDAGRSGARRQAREHRVATPESFRPDPLGELVRQELADALSQLPSPQRDVLVLRIWGELSFGQIGVALGIGSEAARSRHRKALAALRQLMEGR